MAKREGIRPPNSDSTGVSLPVSWGNGRVVAVANGVGSEPFVTPPLARGVYVIQASTPVWWNVGTGEDGGGLDEAVTSENATSADQLASAPKVQLGPDNAIAVDDDERIAVKAMLASKPANVRIFKGA